MKKFKSPGRASWICKLVLRNISLYTSCMQSMISCFIELFKADDVLSNSIRHRRSTYSQVSVQTASVKKSLSKVLGLEHILIMLPFPLTPLGNLYTQILSNIRSIQPICIWWLQHCLLCIIQVIIDLGWPCCCTTILCTAIITLKVRSSI